mgnify:FL=1
MLFFKKKKEESVRELKAFTAGKVIPITEVNDQVFSTKMMGDGVAICPSEDQITAPCNGTVSMVMADSKHAVGITLNNGMEVLLHVGLDTVKLNGEGFNLFVREGDKISTGDPLLSFDRKKVEENGLDTTCVLVITNSDDHPAVTWKTGVQAVAKETVICEF